MYSVFQDMDKKRKEIQRQRELKKNGGKTISMFYSPFVNIVNEEKSKHSSYRSPKKRGRNELCSCGSNKKYKKCCLKTERNEYFFGNFKPKTGETIEFSKTILK